MEMVYYTDGVVWVTDQRLVFVDTTYWLADIRRALIVQVPVRRPYRLQLFVCLCLLPLLLGLLFISSALPDLGLWSYCFLGFHIIAGAGTAFITARAVYHLLSTPDDPIYTLRLHTAAAPVDAYCSLNEEYLRMVLRSIRFAFDERS